VNVWLSRKLFRRRPKKFDGAVWGWLRGLKQNIFVLYCSRFHRLSAVRDKSLE